MEQDLAWWQTEPEVLRPFPLLDEYVLKTLPDVLLKILQNPNETQLYVAELTRDCKTILESLSLEELQKNLSQEEVNVILLELKMLYMAIAHNGNNIPSILLEKIEILNQKTNSPIIMTYEDCVLNNPKGDIRTFFGNTELGNQERFFYRVHQMIEVHLLEVIHNIDRLLDEPRLVRGITKEIKTSLENVNSLMSKIGRELNTEAFTVFRKYFGSINEMHGASGAFTGSIPLIDLLWAGSSGVFPGNKERYTSMNIYFPSTQRSRILDILKQENHPSVIGYVSEKPDFNELSDIIKETLVVFRSRHVGAVKKHAPDVYDDKSSGSGGVDEKTGEYLRKSLDHTKNT